jgi:hypothetical protein
VIEAELTQLASRQPLARRSSGRSRPDVVTVVDRPCTAFVNPEISGADPCLFEPMLERVQSLSDGSVRFLVGLKLYFAVRPERDALTAEEADQPDHETLRALNILCRNPHHHHAPFRHASAVLVWCV